VNNLGKEIFAEPPLNQIPQEFVDSVVLEEKPYPNILPDTATICSMTAGISFYFFPFLKCLIIILFFVDEIRQKILEYTGYSLETLARTLEPNGY
jgi:hypothetical protein